MQISNLQEKKLIWKLRLRNEMHLKINFRLSGSSDASRLHSTLLRYSFLLLCFPRLRCDPGELLPTPDEQKEPKTEGEMRARMRKDKGERILWEHLLLAIQKKKKKKTSCLNQCPVFLIHVM